MIPIKEKLDNLKKRVKYIIHDKGYIKHVCAVIAIAVAAGLAVSMFITRNTTVNDMVIRYTEPPLEELDTEGYNGEEISGDPLTESVSEEETAPEETAASQESQTPGEIPVSEETSETEELQASVMTFIPEVQIKTTMLSSMHRPWILSDLSDMFHSLSTPK